MIKKYMKMVKKKIFLAGKISAPYSLSGSKQLGSTHHPTIKLHKI